MPSSKVGTEELASCQTSFKVNATTSRICGLTGPDVACIALEAKISSEEERLKRYTIVRRPGLQEIW